MANFNSLISVQVAVGTPSLVVQGFGVPLIMTDGNTDFTANEVRVYNSAKDVDADTGLTAQTKVEAKAALSQTLRPTSVKIADIDYTGAPASLAASLAAIIANDDDWYGGVATGTGGFTEANILAFALEFESLKKQYWAQTSDAAVPADTAGNVLEDLAGFGYDRTLGIYAALDTEPHSIVQMSQFLAVNPDVSTTIAAWKDASGVSKQDLTPTEVAAIWANNGNIYGDARGIGNMQKGTMASGNYADVILSKDWLEARIAEGATKTFADFSNQGGKIPFDDSGITVLEAVVQGVLRLAVRVRHIEDGSEFVNSPRIDAVLAADKIARILRLDFGGTLTGAIQETDWTGQLALAV